MNLHPCLRRSCVTESSWHWSRLWEQSLAFPLLHPHPVAQDVTETNVALWRQREYRGHSFEAHASGTHSSWLNSVSKVCCFNFSVNINIGMHTPAGHSLYNKTFWWNHNIIIGMADGAAPSTCNCNVINVRQFLLFLVFLSSMSPLIRFFLPNFLTIQHNDSIITVD